MVPISLKNSSAVEGTHYVNLQPYPEFSLSLLEERGDAYDADDATALQPISLQQCPKPIIITSFRGDHEHKDYL